MALFTFVSRAIVAMAIGVAPQLPLARFRFVCSRASSTRPTAFACQALVIVVTFFAFCVVVHHLGFYQVIQSRRRVWGALGCHKLVPLPASCRAHLHFPQNVGVGQASGLPLHHADKVHCLGVFSAKYRMEVGRLEAAAVANASKSPDLAVRECVAFQPEII